MITVIGHCFVAIEWTTKLVLNCALGVAQPADMLA